MDRSINRSINRRQRRQRRKPRRGDNDAEKTGKTVDTGAKNNPKCSGDASKPADNDRLSSSGVGWERQIVLVDDNELFLLSNCSLIMVFSFSSFRIWKLHHWKTRKTFVGTMVQIGLARFASTVMAYWFLKMMSWFAKRYNLMWTTDYSFDKLCMFCQSLEYRAQRLMVCCLMLGVCLLLDAWTLVRPILEERPLGIALASAQVPSGTQASIVGEPPHLFGATLCAHRMGH